jgi:hypothetical protein
MAWKKSPPELIERFKAALPPHPDAQVKQMFGYPACFVKGNFFTGTFEDNLVIRLPNGLKDQFPELKNAAGFNPMGTGKGMKDWCIIPAEIANDNNRLADFYAATFEEVYKLPAKVVKPRKPRKSVKGS